MGLGLGALVIGNLTFDEIRKSPECGEHEEHRKEPHVEDGPKYIKKKWSSAGDKDQQNKHEQTPTTSRLIMLSILHKIFPKLSYW